jgi:NhaP-type Na+/H+ or K+/H+ antiporter
VIAYGGLKGAIGISFAMIIFEDNAYSLKTRNLFLMHVTANSLITLLINGMTTGLVINLLRISNLTKV